MKMVFAKSLSVTSLLAIIATGPAWGDFLFGEPENLGPLVNSTSNEAGITLSSDGLELYFSSQRADGNGDYDIWICTRQSVAEAWGPPANLGAPVNSPYVELYPCLSADDLTLYFSDYYSGSPRPGGLGGGDIWMTTRASRDHPWTTPVNLGDPVNIDNLDMSPTVSADGLTLVFTSRSRPGGIGSWDVWISTRAEVADPWEPPVNAGPGVNSGNWDGESGLSADGRALVFGSGRPGLAGSIDLWMSTRQTVADPWTDAVNLGEVINSDRDDGTARFSPDMRTLYFCSNRVGTLGGYDLYAAPITPIVDFDGNESVDIADLLRLIESWGQDDPACDVGPAPWGDGIVDAEDLEVLMSYWGQEIPSPFLIAHWKLDEAEGMIALDSERDHDATVMGVPHWQPQGGAIGGALQLNGAPDFATADTVRDPSEGPLSVFAWIKGGAPGQVVISQQAGANWLMADPATGALMTELRSGGRQSKTLSSEVAITDNSWHRIAFTWDGSHRRLYVDDVLVAEDADVGLMECYGNLNIGCGATMTPTAFFTGLIDDVRIYNRAVKP
ncbi:MAG: PD40 domain-containing protein [Sedimentisphaerales bacterium]|nr:PD40 domain-containing protein [Sedimentisphaerales bacterium]